jgi:hypothetical protein
MRVKYLILPIIAAMLVTSILFIPVNGADSFDHTDPSGDVENMGMSTEAVENVDIVALSMETSGTTLIFEMTVDGLVTYTGSSYIYIYIICLDQVGDGSESTTITVSTGSAMFISDYGMGGGFNLPLSGNGTDTLRVELTTTSIDTANHPVQEIYGSAVVSDEMIGANDYINEDFGYSNGDDDDDPPPDDDDVTPDDDDDDIPIRDYYAPDKEYDSDEDPKEETPTDPTLEVDIDSFDYWWEQSGGREEWEETMTGTGDGDVIYAAFSKVFYYKDGSHEDVEWLMGAYNLPRNTIQDATHESHFKGTGPGGKDDWTAWEMYFYGEREMDPDDPAGLNSSCVDVDEVESVFIYVRVFSDEDLLVWNQDSIDVTDDYLDPDIIAAMGDDDDGGGVSGDDDDDDDGGDDSPGFELALILPVILAVILVGYLYRRKR